MRRWSERRVVPARTRLPKRPPATVEAATIPRLTVPRRVSFFIGAALLPLDDSRAGQPPETWAGGRAGCRRRRPRAAPPRPDGHTGQHGSPEDQEHGDAVVVEPAVDRAQHLQRLVAEEDPQEAPEDV